jgi:Holliday junction resolvase-like predicted endonuclease
MILPAKGPSPPMTMNSFQVAVAAEAYVAALLSQAGCDVSIQYGANQPEYDLIATKNNFFRKISVKGSKDGGWVLAAGLKKGREYHQAIEAWVDKHKDKNVIYAFVQFKDVSLGDMPRIYLCTVREAANYLKSSRGTHGYTSLRERYVWASGIAKGATDLIPEAWRATQERVDALIR